MSRIPFGLCLLLLCHGCASFRSQAQPPTFVGQVPNQQARPSSQNSLGSNGGFVSGEDSDLPPNAGQATVSQPYRAYPGGPVIQLGEMWPLLNRPQPQEKQAPIFPQVLPDPQSSIPSLTSLEVARPVWEGQLKSTGGRPIEISAFGQGPFRVLLLGSIYGNEPESLALIDNFTKDATSQISEQLALVIVRTPNPDGLAERTRTNKNGVDLNRNFPSKWFTATPSRLTGPHAASEIETQHLVTLIEKYRPQRVIHVRSSIGVRPLLLVNSRFRSVEKMFAETPEIDLGSFGGQFKTASLEEYVSVQSGLELMTIHLPPEGFPQLKTGDLLAIVNANSETTEAPSLLLDRPLRSTPKEARETKDRPEPDGEKGYVQFLPPPPTPERINATSGSGRQMTPEYFELVPPPRVQ